MIPFASGEVKCHTSDFRVKNKFLTSFSRPSDLTHASPWPPFLPFQLFAISSSISWLYFSILFISFGAFAIIIFIYQVFISCLYH